MIGFGKSQNSRLDRLQEHLKAENEDLMKALDAYRGLDAIAQRMGLLSHGQSYADSISWWPLISILGTFSAGKSSFINSYLGLPLQRTGNQAVDDRFTVIVYGRDKDVKTLPGQALDSDPRFPFFRISQAIEEVAPGEGRRVDRYLEMKAVPSEQLKGKIVIDSPGFDADDQRTATLRITRHIIGLSDLVLVLFDARHPEAGAMRDTLKHLVAEVVGQTDLEKFVYILNQIDTSARENNLEDIVAAWRGSLTQQGLTAGRFYISYNKDVAQPVADKAVWSAYEAKRDHDHRQILQHVDTVNVFRTYRIVGRIKLLANALEERTVPALTEAYADWRRGVLAADSIFIAALVGAGIYWRQLWTGEWLFWAIGGLVVFLAWHFGMRRLMTRLVAKRLREEDETGNLRAAFRKSTAFWRPMLAGLRGWSFMAWRRLKRVREEAEGLIEALNTRNTDPSGRLQQSGPRGPSAPEAAPEPAPAPAKAVVVPAAASIRPAPTPASATPGQASAAQSPRPQAAAPGGGPAAPLTAGLQLSPAQAAKPAATPTPAAPGAGSASPPAKSQGGPG